MRSWMNDLVVTASTLAVAAGFGYLYYRDINQQIILSGQKPIGTITYERNNTERRYGDRVVWEQVSDNAPLYNQDSIRTAGDSDAVIRLIDGTQISLSPDTLITLDWGPKAKAVDFVSGSITAIRTGGGPGEASGGAQGVPGSVSGAGGRAAAGQPTAAPSGLVIRSGRSQVVVDQATVSLAHGAGGELSVDVASGEASLGVGNSVQTVSAAQAAHVNTSTGAATVTEVDLAPLSPAANAIFVTRGDAAPVDFSWRSASPAKAYSLQLSPTPAFDHGVRTFTAAAESTTEGVAPGVYYWRVGAAGATSSAQQLTVLHDVAIVPETPASGTVFGYDSGLPLLSFSWSASRVASGYELQVATDPQFTKVVANVGATTTSISVNSLGAGSYYWRVVPVYGFGTSGGSAHSASASFRIVRDTRLKAATLVAPAEGADLNTLSVNSAGLLFNWTADHAIARWTLLLARDTGLTDVVRREMTVNNFFLLRRPLIPGTYYWQVRGIDGYGVQAPHSAIRAFKIHLHTATIKLKSPEANWAYDGATFANVPVVWQSDILGTYEVQLSTRADFSALYNQIKTTFNNATFGSIPPGTYFWHVLLLSQDGSTLLSSGDQAFTVLPPLVAPLAVTPAPGKGFDLINAPNLPFRWDGDPRSEFYDFTLYGPSANGGMRIIASAKDLKVNEYILKDLSGLVPGAYTWEIDAHNPSGPSLSAQESQPTLANFTIRHLRIIPAPRLLSPFANMQIDGPSALDHGVSFSWISPDPEGSAIIQVASDRSFSKNLKQLPAGPGVSSVSLPELLPGTYYWQVKAMTHDGIDAPPSAINEFTVATLPSLAQPTGVSPSPQATVDMWDKPALSFSWRPVPDATSYSLSLVDATSGRVVFSVTNVAGTSYQYTELHNLNIGTFVWKIQATQTDHTGQAVRSSEPLQIRFNIALGNKIGPADINSPRRFFVH